jgi:hypothetical protein
MKAFVITGRGTYCDKNQEYFLAQKLKSISVFGVISPGSLIYVAGLLPVPLALGIM